jgi:hypothetical protein
VAADDDPLGLDPVSARGLQRRVGLEIIVHGTIEIRWRRERAVRRGCL